MPTGRILVVDDNAEVAETAALALRREGFAVDIAATPRAGLKAAEENPPDLLILDIVMPGMDGYEFLRELRKHSNVPVIFLSAKGEVDERVLGLRLGADDYLPKPFAPKELAARVSAVLTRSARPLPAARCPRFGPVEVDLERREVRLEGRPRELTPKEFDVLACLVRAGGKPLSREALLEKVWGYEKGLELSTRTVDQHVARLRRKLRGGRSRIVTVSKAGYRLDLDPG